MPDYPPGRATDVLIMTRSALEATDIAEHLAGMGITGTRTVSDLNDAAQQMQAASGALRLVVIGFDSTAPMVQEILVVLRRQQVPVVAIDAEPGGDTDHVVIPLMRPFTHDDLDAALSRAIAAQREPDAGAD